MCLKFEDFAHKGPACSDHPHVRTSHAPTDACGPTHTPRAFLQFLARSDDGTARRTQASLQDPASHRTTSRNRYVHPEPSWWPNVEFRWLCGPFRPKGFSAGRLGGDWCGRPWWVSKLFICFPNKPQGGARLGVQLDPSRSQMSRILPVDNSCALS